MATILPSVVTIPDLTAATTISTATLFEAVQTTSGAIESVKVSLSQIMTTGFGGLPTGGGTGQLLSKVSGTDYVTQWQGIASALVASTGISIAGSTVATVAFATTSPLSVLGVAGAATASPAPIIGAASQLLAVNAAATMVLFQSASGYIDTALSSTQGAILYRNAASWVPLAPGTNGQVLQTQGATANPRYIGALVLLNTLTPNGVASTNDTTSLTSIYANYLVTFENVCPATQTTTFQMQVSTSASAFISGTYVSIAQVNVSSVIITDTSTTALLLSGIRSTTQLQTTLAYGLNGFVRFANPAGTLARKYIYGETTFLTPGAAGTTTHAMTQLSGYYDGTTSPVVGLNFLFNSGNIATGTIKIYAVL